MLLVRHGSCILGDWPLTIWEYSSHNWLKGDVTTLTWITWIICKSPKVCVIVWWHTPHSQRTTEHVYILACYVIDWRQYFLSSKCQLLIGWYGWPCPHVWLFLTLSVNFTLPAQQWPSLISPLHEYSCLMAPYLCTWQGAVYTLRPVTSNYVFTMPTLHSLFFLWGFFSPDSGAFLIFFGEKWCRVILLILWKGDSIMMTINKDCRLQTVVSALIP